MLSLRFFLSLLLFTTALGATEIEPRPLVQAHAHNDYEHARPLHDALACGFGSIEADIHLVEGRLLVAHDRKSVKPERTLEALYLDPLRDRVRQNGGRVYPGGPTITLLVDVKTEAVATYAVLHVVLGRYADILTVFRSGVPATKAVTVVLSGNRARAEVVAQTERFVSIDGRIEDLATNPPPALVPWVSDNWQKVSAWKWTGPMPAADRAKLLDLVTQAHVQGRRIRFWNTPDRPDAWQILHSAGVDLIGTDHLPELRDFLLPLTSGAREPAK
jgi:Glycerophosphoryl diester phosphodiesterase family